MIHLSCIPDTPTPSGDFLVTITCAVGDDDTPVSAIQGVLEWDRNRFDLVAFEPTGSWRDGTTHKPTHVTTVRETGTFNGFTLHGTRGVFSIAIARFRQRWTGFGSVINVADTLVGDENGNALAHETIAAAIEVPA